LCPLPVGSERGVPSPHALCDARSRAGSIQASLIEAPPHRWRLAGVEDAAGPYCDRPSATICFNLSTSAGTRLAQRSMPRDSVQNPSNAMSCAAVYSERWRDRSASAAPAVVISSNGTFGPRCGALLPRASLSAGGMTMTAPASSGDQVLHCPRCMKRSTEVIADLTIRTVSSPSGQS
jgi:hypothetical protein